MESLFVAAELAQTHYVERRILDTYCDDVLDLLQNLFEVFAVEHVLIHTDVEAPNADSEHCPRPCACSKLRSIGGSMRLKLLGGCHCHSSSKALAEAVVEA